MPPHFASSLVTANEEVRIRLLVACKPIALYNIDNSSLLSVLHTASAIEVKAVTVHGLVPHTSTGHTKSLMADPNGIEVPLSSLLTSPFTVRQTSFLREPPPPQCKVHRGTSFNMASLPVPHPTSPSSDLPINKHMYY